MTRRKAAAGALPGLEDAGEDKSQGGPVYQGVCLAIRTLFARPAGHTAKCPCEACEAVADRKARLGGTIAQARSIAASVDRVSGHGGTRQASGVQLAAMHEQLDKLLLRLDPDADGDDFEDFQEEMRRAREEAAQAWQQRSPDTTR